MGKRQAPRHKHRGNKGTVRKFVISPSLKWLEHGQVLFATISWSDENGEGEKRRPVVFLEQIDHNHASVRALYSRRGADHNKQVTYNRSRRYCGPPIEVHRDDITTVTNERIKWD